MNVISEELVRDILVMCCSSGILFMLFVVPFAEIVSDILVFTVKKVRIRYYKKKYGDWKTVLMLKCYDLAENKTIDLMDAMLIEESLKHYSTGKRFFLKRRNV